MYILVIANGNGMSTNVGGSMGRTFEIFGRLMKKDDVKVRFLTTVGGFEAGKSFGLKEKSNFKVLSIPGLKKVGNDTFSSRLYSYIFSVFAAPFLLRSFEGIELIYTDSDYFCDVIPAVLARVFFRNAKWTASIHHLIKVDRSSLFSLVVSLASRVFQYFSLFLVRFFSSAVLVYDTVEGDRIKELLARLGFSRSRIFPMTNGVDTDFIGSVAPKPVCYTAGFVGGLRPSKGIYDLVKIWKGVVDAVPDACLAAIGGGSKGYVSKMKEEIQKNGLEENIKLLGPKPHDEAISFVKSSSVFIFPSYKEGWGTAVCEALSCGVPVVVYDLEVYRRSFGDCLRVVPVGDTEEFSRRVLELLGEKELRERLSHRGKSLVKRFDWEQVAARDYANFLEILG